MNVLIVEDETAAATNLKALLLQIDPSIRIEAVIETVVETVRWVKDNPLPDLIFMDIHLADGRMDLKWLLHLRCSRDRDWSG